MEESSFDFDFSFAENNLAEMQDILEDMEESLKESHIPFGEESMAPKKSSDVPHEHNYAFRAKRDDPLWSQHVPMASTQNSDQRINKCLMESDTSVLSKEDEEWADQFLNFNKQGDSSNSLTGNSHSEPQQQLSSLSCTQNPIHTSVVASTKNSTKSLAVDNSPDSTISSTSKKNRKRKISGNSSYSTESDNVTVLDRNTKNAIAARENRLKKKQYIEGLEKKNQELEKANKVMQDKTEEQEERIDNLEREVAYLKNILHNQSALSSLLGNLDPDAGVRLSISGQGGKRRRGGGGSKEVIPMSKGVCLHVDGQTASLEFCSLCAMKAKGGSI